MLGRSISKQNPNFLLHDSYPHRQEWGICESDSHTASLECHIFDSQSTRTLVSLVLW
jgi:hypothetical protein